VPRSASSAITARSVRSGFSAIRASSHSRSPVNRSGRRPPIGLAAALPVSRHRCDHFTCGPDPIADTSSIGILLFNNGVGRPGGNYSSVDEIVPPVNDKGEYAYKPAAVAGKTGLTELAHGAEARHVE